MRALYSSNLSLNKLGGEGGTPPPGAGASDGPRGAGGLAAPAASRRLRPRSGPQNLWNPMGFHAFGADGAQARKSSDRRVPKKRKLANLSVAAEISSYFYASARRGRNGKSGRPPKNIETRVHVCRPREVQMQRFSVRGAPSRTYPWRLKYLHISTPAAAREGKCGRVAKKTGALENHGKRCTRMPSAGGPEARKSSDRRVPKKRKLANLAVAAEIHSYFYASARRGRNGESGRPPTTLKTVYTHAARGRCRCKDVPSAVPPGEPIRGGCNTFIFPRLRAARRKRKIRPPPGKH